MNQFPVIRLEVEGMKHSIVHAFTAHNEEVEKYVDEQVGQAIKNFDLEAYISAETNKQINAVIDSTLKRYLGWSLNTAIEEAAKAEILKRLNGEATK